jgi:hypothetical protein
MVLLPCSNCCQTPCACPTCVCCQCVSWQEFFNYYAVGGQPGFYYLRPDTDLSLYDGLERAGVCNLTRAFQSQQACVDYYDALYPGYPYWALDGEPCGRWYNVYGYGWSAPLIDGQPATPAMLEELCPDGANPPDFTGDGLTYYKGTGQFTGAGTPDIHTLVFRSGQSTGDPIADALFARGTRNDLPALPWQEADDCGSCASPPAYEYDCDPATDDKRFYAKTVDWAFTHPSYNNPQEPQCPVSGDDPLGFCPPQNCKEVTITVTRTDKCGSDDVVTEWKAIVYVCPCVLNPIIGVDPDTGDLWEAAYGYDSEAACIADWNNANCIGNQWKQVRHEIDGTNRQLMPQDCCDAGPYGYYC